MTSRPWAWLAPARVRLRLSPSTSPCRVALRATSGRSAEAVRTWPSCATSTGPIAGSPATPTLAGARCEGRGVLHLPRPPATTPEKTPPADGHKRFEIRLAAATAAAPRSIRRPSGTSRRRRDEACFYIDVPAGQRRRTSPSRPAPTAPSGGFAPRSTSPSTDPRALWYDILAVECAGAAGRCNRQGADAWAARDSRSRKRGRIDPCGSAVISRPGLGHLGRLRRSRGRAVTATSPCASRIEVKKFATQFAPGSTECVPK